MVKRSRTYWKANGWIRTRRSRAKQTALKAVEITKEAEQHRKDLQEIDAAYGPKVLVTGYKTAGMIKKPKGESSDSESPEQHHTKKAKSSAAGKMYRSALLVKLLLTLAGLTTRGDVPTKGTYRAAIPTQAGRESRSSSLLLKTREFTGIPGNNRLHLKIGSVEIRVLMKTRHHVYR